MKKVLLAVAVLVLAGCNKDPLVGDYDCTYTHNEEKPVHVYVNVDRVEDGNWKLVSSNGESMVFSKMQWKGFYTSESLIQTAVIQNTVANFTDNNIPNNDMNDYQCKKSK